jgi:type IV pilus assembly protein PilE
MMRQEQYFIDHKQYAESLSDLGFLANPYAIDSEGEEVSVLDEQRIYLVSLVTTEYAYTLNATPLLGQTKDRLCGTLSLDSRGIKLATGDGHVRECW